MRIAMIGTGYVGLVSGVCFSDFGHDVVCVDKDASKIAKLEAGDIPIFEPGLDTLLAKNVEAGRLSFTLDLAEALEGCGAVFIAVGTPTRRGDGHADLKYVEAAAREIATTATGPITIVTKSTVPVGTNRKVGEWVRDANPDLDFDIASNPEFLREGAAIDDFMRPDRVVVGVESNRAAKTMADIYRPLFLRDFPIVTTDLESAEMIKYAANAFLATKITFINEIAALYSAPSILAGWPKAWRIRAWRICATSIQANAPRMRALKPMSRSGDARSPKRSPEAPIRKIMLNTARAHHPAGRQQP